MTCAVVIPVYKAKMSDIERVSFEQCLSILGPAHPIYLATYPQLDIGEYESISEHYGVKLHTSFFREKRFKSIHSYNCLMLSPDFYVAFKEFTYILIYQLDAYVFEDKLTEWCEKGYDYVGAPLYTPMGEMNIDTAIVGNGGFSLRRIEVFHSALSSRYNPFVHRNWHPYVNWHKRALYFLMLAFSGWANSVRGFFTHWVDEDRFFSFALLGTPHELKTPSAREALAFSLDLLPEVGYAANGFSLPFGCHQWHNDRDFWEKFGC